MLPHSDPPQRSSRRYSDLKYKMCANTASYFTLASNHRAVVNRADRRLAAGAGSCCKPIATVGTCYSQSSFVVLTTPSRTGTDGSASFRSAKLLSDIIKPRRRNGGFAQWDCLCFVCLFICLSPETLRLPPPVSHMFPPSPTPPREIYAGGGGLLTCDVHKLALLDRKERGNKRWFCPSVCLFVCPSCT